MLPIYLGTSNYFKNNVFEIKFIFLFLTIYFVFIPFLIADISLVTALALAYVLIGCLSFWIGYKTKAHFAVRAASLKASKFVIASALLFALIDFWSGFNSFTGDFSTQDYTESFAVTDFDSLYTQIPIAIFFAIKYFIFSIAITKNKFIFYSIFLSQVALSITSPTRLVVLQPLIIFIIFGFYYGYIKITYLKIVLSIILAPFLFLLMLFVRGTGGGGNYLDVILKAYDNINLNDGFQLMGVALESFRSFEDLVNIIRSNFVHFESGVIRVFSMPISRSIWPEKPESISRIISKEFNVTQYDSGGGSVALIFGDAFINGHIIGVILILFFLGCASRIIYNTMYRGLLLSPPQRGVLIMMYSVFAYDFLFFYRGFFSEFYWKIIIFLSCFTLLYKLFFSRNGSSR